MDTSPASSSTDRLPDWLAEALDVLSARRRVVVATAVGLVLLGAIVALVAPSILPARAIVGAAVGVAAALLATALALAMDASDLVVRGSRHVRAAGGTVDVRVGRQHDDVGPLLAAVARHASNGRVRVALSAASRTAGVPGARASALAEALARTGRKVLLTDLTRGGTPAAGLSDVITGARTLPDVVRFEQQLYLARLAVGSDPDAAVRGFASWVEGLPSDLEVLVVALPPLAERGVLKAAGAMDLTLVLVEVDRTERVDLIASLDAVDAAGLASQLVLVDPHRTGAEVRGVAPPTDEVPTEAAQEPVHEPAVALSPFEDHAAPGPAAGEAGPDETGAAEGPRTELDPADAGDRELANAMRHDEFAAAADDEDVLAEIGLDPAPEPAPDHDVVDTSTEVSAVLGGTDALAAATREDDGFSGAAADDAPDGEASEDEVAGESADEVEVLEGTGGLTDDREADATAEIMLPGTSPDGGFTHIWDDPEPTHEPGPESTPAAQEPDPWTSMLGVTDPQAVAEPEPAAPEREPAPEPEPGPPARSEAVSPPDDARVPEPVMAQGDATRPDPSEGGLDAASMEVARTSAALHQLAQQIWDRDDR